jgi:hypothetical protein
MLGRHGRPYRDLDNVMFFTPYNTTATAQQLERYCIPQKMKTILVHSNNPKN